MENNTCASGPGPARPRAIGCKRAGDLGDAFAGPTGELLTHVLDYLPPARDELQLGDIVPYHSRRVIERLHTWWKREAWLADQPEQPLLQFSESRKLDKTA